MKVDLETIKDRMLAFWAGESIGRAFLAVDAPLDPGANISVFHNDDREMAGDREAIRSYWEDPEIIRQNSLKRMERAWYGGEKFPVIFQNYGPGGQCRYFGAKPVYGNDTIWFSPEWAEIPEIVVLDESEVERQQNIARALTAGAGSDYLVGMPDNCGTYDAILQLRGAENLMSDFIEAPEDLEKAARDIDRICNEIHERFYLISRDINCGGVHAWMHLWAPGRIVQMQCDFSVMVSTGIFERFALPELHRQSEWSDYAVYHFDGIAQERHLDMILSVPGLRAVQWSAVAGEPPPSHSIPILRRIQQANKNLIVMCPPEDVAPLLDNLSSRGLYLHTTASTPEEGKDILRMVERQSTVR